MPTSKSKQKVWDDLRTMVAAEETGFVRDRRLVWHLAMAAEIVSRRHNCDFWEALEAYPLYIVAVDPNLSKHTLRERLKQAAATLLGMRGTSLWKIFERDIEVGRAAANDILQSEGEDTCES